MRERVNDGRATNNCHSFTGFSVYLVDMEFVMEENLYTKCLIEDLKLWKKEVGASYDDIAEILGCSKGYLWDFCRRPHRISYEFGKRIEGLVLWSEEAVCKNRKKTHRRISNLARGSKQ